MRPTTILGVAMFGMSAAAIVQIAETPTDQRTTANDAAPLDGVMANITPEANETAPDAAMTTRALGDPTAASDAPRK